MHHNSDDTPHPRGALCLQTQVLPRDGNAAGDVSGGWLVSQMDLAAEMAAQRRAQGRVATVAIDQVVFLHPLCMGDVVAIHADLLEIGRSSMKITVEAWTVDEPGQPARKLSEGLFTFVAINATGRTRPLP